MDPPSPHHGESHRSVPTGDIVLLIALILAVAGILLWLAGDIVLVIFAGILLAIGLDGLASLMSQYTPVPRRPALAIVTVVLLGGIAGLAVLVVPSVAGEVDQIWSLIVSTVESVRARFASWGWPQEVMEVEEVDPERIFDIAGGLVGPMANITLGAVTAVGSVLVVITFAVFAAYDPGLYRRGFITLFPARQRSRIDDALFHVARALRWWFLGQLVSMIVLAVTVSLGLWLFGVDLWLSLGVLAGALTFIPILGPLIAGIPIVIVAFADGADTGLYVLAFYLVVQNVEGNVLVPYIQHKAVHLAPALLIATQILFGALLGVLGFVLAAPLTVVGMVLVQRLYTRSEASEG